MSNIRVFPQRQDRASRAAGDWIAAMGRGLTQKEEEQLGAWLSSDKKNYDELMELARLWDEMDALERLAQLFPEPPQQRRQFVLRRLLATAASLLVACLVFFVLSTSNFSIQTAREIPSVAISESYDTKIGEHTEYSLPDGSIMTLNTNSAVRADFTVSNRVLILERGELHIAVAHDPNRPLSVLVGNKVVQAVGTEFNVEITTDNSIELIVTDGVVMVGVVEGPDTEVLMDKPLLLTQSSTIVGAGERILVRTDDQNAGAVDAGRVASDEIAVKLSWREGNLIFRGESLEEAVSEVERYTAVEFIFLDEDAKKVRVAGLFKAGDVDGLLAAFRDHFRITYEWQGDDRILLSTQQ